MRLCRVQEVNGVGGVTETYTFIRSLGSAEVEQVGGELAGSAPRKLLRPMTSQLGSAAVSDSEEDGVSLMEGVPDGRLDAAPPALQLRTSLQDVTAAAGRLQTRSRH